MAHRSCEMGRQVWVSFRFGALTPVLLVVFGMVTSAVCAADAVEAPGISLTGSEVLTRGPYLQNVTPTGIVVRWRTDEPVDSRVRYGTALGSLDGITDDPAPTTEHVVPLSGLLPGTRYYYSVGTTTQALAGGDASHFFMTSPGSAASGPIRIWVLGCSGTANEDARNVRDAYASHDGGVYTNLWLMLGDNAYDAGTDSEHQAAVFDTYPEMLRKSPLFTAVGNHDSYSCNSSTQTGPYYDIFTLPTQGEGGGIPTGTEAYYSFDYGNVHFICLDSADLGLSPTGDMLTWARQDALSTTQDWTIAYWHHPPYSRGPHNSDAELEMIQIRENLIPFLEDAGVDLVLSAHSHSYERSYLVDGHYGFSGTFTEAMKKDAGDGRLDSQGAYRKPSIGPAPRGGTVYVVAGSAGQAYAGYGTFDHPAMFRSLVVLGSLVLDVNGQQLDARFLDSTGTVQDYFTIFKGPGAAPVTDFAGAPLAGPAPLTVGFVDVSANKPSAWKWDFEDDGTVDSRLQNPSHTYSTPGIYAVRLTAYNAPGSDFRVKGDYVCVTSSDGLGDTDADGVADGVDRCPCASDPGQVDTDGDGLGNACDPDDDNDSVPDAHDCAPLDGAISAVPAEIGGTVVMGPGPDGIAWTGVSQAVSFNLYRGAGVVEDPFAFNHACFEPKSSDTESSDPENPAPAAYFYYLASGWNSCGESPLGSRSDGEPRPNSSPCP